MPDAFAGPLARRILALLPPDAPRTRADLGRLPGPIARYLEGVLDRRLALDAALPASPWFDGAAEPVRDAAAAWRAATRDTARFPEDAWAAAVDDASEQVLAYLVTPPEALADYVFDGEPDAPLGLDRVRARMAAFASYPYLREIAEGFFARKELDAIGRDDFEALLRRIDRRMAGGFGPDEWANLLGPLFEVSALLSDAGIPTLLLRRFFVAKGADELARRLDAEAYDEDALRRTLTDLFPATPTEAPTAPPEATDAPLPPDAEDTGSAEPEGIAATEVAPPEEEPLWQRLARQSESAQLQAEAAPADDTPLWKRLAPDADGAAPAPLTSAVPDTDVEELGAAEVGTAGVEAGPMREATVARSAEPAPPEPLLALETRVLGASGTTRRSWYVEHLVGGDEAAYRSVLEALDGSPDWTTASKIIARDIFRAHRVNIYSDAAVAFTDAVEARYTS